MRYGSFRKSTKSFEAPPQEVARSRRIDVAVVSSVEVDGQRINVQLSDLSARGVGGRSAIPLPIGAEGTITLPRIGPVPLQIRWALGGRSGARFLARVQHEDLFAAPAMPPAE